jgi:hypothetical protein
MSILRIHGQLYQIIMSISFMTSILSKNLKDIYHYVYIFNKKGLYFHAWPLYNFG